MEEVVNNILKVYEKHKLDQSIDMTQFLNYENVRNLTFGEERKTSEVIEAMHKNMEFKGAEGYKKAAFS